MKNCFSSINEKRRKRLDYKRIRLFVVNKVIEISNLDLLGDLAEVLSCLSNSEWDMYYLRDSAGNEVDVVLEKDGNLIPVEIKSSSNTTRSDFKNIKWFQRFYRINDGILINQIKEIQELENGIMNIGWAEVANV